MYRLEKCIVDSQSSMAKIVSESSGKDVWRHCIFLNIHNMCLPTEIRDHLHRPLSTLQHHCLLPQRCGMCFAVYWSVAEALLDSAGTQSAHKSANELVTHAMQTIAAEGGSRVLQHYRSVHNLYRIRRR